MAKLNVNEWAELPAHPRTLGTRFLLTPAYLRGAYDAQCGRYQNPYKPGTSLAQYNYGFGNEKQGVHDELDLPLDGRLQDDPNEYYKGRERGR